jgi:phosphoglycerate kinase
MRLFLYKLALEIKMNKLTIDDVDLKGKKVLMRVDFNVPLDDNLNIRDDTRITAALPSIRKIIDSGGRAILMSHLGRPKGKRVDDMSLKPIAERLSVILKKDINFTDDCIGESVKFFVDNLENGEVLLLENLRYHKEETENDPEFAKKLAEFGDIYINDAFGTAHRAHASTEGVTKYMSVCAAGYLMQKEIEFLGKAIANPKRPFTAILGGAKISGKIDVIKNLMPKVDNLIIGGGMTFTFLKSRDQEIGKSLLEEEKIELAKEILSNASISKVRLVLPTDTLVASEFSNDSPGENVPVESIPENKMGLDIGINSINEFQKIILESKTVVWNGPMGVFEFDNYAKGTIAIANALAEATRNGAITIVGGGDSAAAIKKAGLTDKVSHVSTGGGASLEFLEGKLLPGLAALSDK